MHAIHLTAQQPHNAPRCRIEPHLIKATALRAAAPAALAPGVRP
jgi:hypothetical protein